MRAQDHQDQSQDPLCIEISGVDPTDDGSLRLLKFLNKIYEAESKPRDNWRGQLSAVFRRLCARCKCASPSVIKTKLSLTFGALDRLEPDGIPALVSWLVSAMWCCESVDISLIRPDLITEVKKQLVAALSEAVVRDPRDKTVPDPVRRLGLRVKAGDATHAGDERVIVLEPWASTVDLTKKGFDSLDVTL